MHIRYMLPIPLAITKWPWLKAEILCNDAAKKDGKGALWRQPHLQRTCFLWKSCPGTVRLLWLFHRLLHEYLRARPYPSQTQSPPLTLWSVSMGRCCEQHHQPMIMHWACGWNYQSTSFCAWAGLQLDWGEGRHTWKATSTLLEERNYIICQWGPDFTEIQDP